MAGSARPGGTGEEQGSTEFFYLDEDGEKGDADLHEEMLGDGVEDDEAARIMREAVADGLDPEVAESLYG